MPSRDLDWHGTPLASLSDSRSQQPISFLIKHFRSSWGFCLATRMITCSRGKSRATTHACDSRPWQFLVTRFQTSKNILTYNGNSKFLPEFRWIFWYYVFRGIKSDFNPSFSESESLIQNENHSSFGKLTIHQKYRFEIGSQSLWVKGTAFNLGTPLRTSLIRDWHLLVHHRRNFFH